ncbi:MAG: hypothetical protein WAS54_08435 [Scrofimicrobium sp.]
MTQNLRLDTRFAQFRLAHRAGSSERPTGHGEHAGQLARLAWIDLVISIPSVASSPQCAMILGYWALALAASADVAITSAGVILASSDPRSVISFVTEASACDSRVSSLQKARKIAKVATHEVAREEREPRSSLSAS